MAETKYTGGHHRGTGELHTEGDERFFSQPVDRRWATRQYEKRMIPSEMVYERLRVSTERHPKFSLS